uniref:FERM domain-containing protein n=1 Tax=Macrostomum lignano TaxID=282301 RepID=A0A1I8I685_9PLAT
MILSHQEGKNVSIHLLDGNTMSIFVRPRLLVSELLDLVASHYDLGADRCYFGFCCYYGNQTGSGFSAAAATTTNGVINSSLVDLGTEFWLPGGARVLDHELCRQQSQPQLMFRVKFYPLSYSRIENRSALQLFYLQCRQLLLRGRLHCGCDLDLFNLAALALQIELGDFDSEKQTVAYYKVLSGMSRTDALYSYLRLASEQSNYGQTLFAVQDSAGLPWWLGVGLRGLALFDHGDRQNPRQTLDWPALENVFHRDRRVCFDVHCDPRRQSMSRWLSPCRSGQAPATLTLNTESPAMARNLFNFAVSQHKFALDIGAEHPVEMSTAAAAVSVATAAAAAAFAAVSGGGGGVGGAGSRRSSIEQAGTAASFASGVNRFSSGSYAEAAEEDIPEDDDSPCDRRPPPMFTRADDAASGATAADWPEQLRQRSSGRGPASHLRELKRSGRLAISQSVNRDQKIMQANSTSDLRLLATAQHHQQHHNSAAFDGSAAAAAASAGPVEDSHHSLPGSQRSSSSDLMLATSAAASAAASMSAISADRATRLDPAACFTLRRVGRTAAAAASAAGGSAGLSGLEPQAEHQRRLLRYHELRSLLADLKAQRDAKQLELRRLTAQERALTQGVSAVPAAASRSQDSGLSSAGKSNSQSSLAAAASKSIEKCVSTQFLLAVDSQKSAADTMLYRESKASRQSKQLRKQRHMEYQQALDKLSNLNAKMQQLRGKLSEQETANSVAMATAAADSANDSQYSSSLMYNSSSPMTTNCIGSSSEHFTIVAPTPRTLLSGQAVDHNGAGSGDSSRGSSSRSIASGSAKHSSQSQYHQQPQQPLHQYSVQPPAQQQQQHRVTQSSLDSGFQDSSFHLPVVGSSHHLVAASARLSVTSSSSASAAAPDYRILQQQQQQQ